MIRMPFELSRCTPPDVLAALAAAIEQAKGGDRLAPVTVVVPTNVAGVMARRGLGRQPGILGVDMVTLNRLAELLAGPALAHAKRRPVSAPLLDLTIRQVLDEAPGIYGPVAHHPATVVALRELHQELRLAGEESRERLARSRRGREAVRISNAVTRMLRRQWYDEADLFAGATERLRTEPVPGLDHIVLYLPNPYEDAARRFVAELAATRSITIMSVTTGDEAADAEPRRLAAQFVSDTPPAGLTATVATPAQVVSVTDADDEVRVAVRTIVDAARGVLTGKPVPLERIAVLWPSQSPYARLVEHHLTTDGIAWNGPSGTELVERIAPRLLLELLGLDRRGLQRRAVFEFLADLPVRDHEGRPLRTGEWERVSRVAGLSGDDDWERRLGRLTGSDRWGEVATSLLEFVTDLRKRLGRPTDTKPWTDWVEWCDGELRSWLGPGAISRFSDPEYRAWEALMTTLERLRSLDAIAPATRHEFRAVLEAELTDAPLREGRIGTGVTVGSLASAGGLMIDVAIVLGAREGSLPPAPRSDPMLSARDRADAGLPSSDERARRLHHAFVATSQTAHTVATFPRGDLRATTANQPTRWLGTEALDSAIVVESSTAGIAALTFPPAERERRLRDRLHLAADRQLTAELPALSGDVTTIRALRLREARATDELTPFDGDLSAAGVPRITAAPGEPDVRPVSPTQIQAWASCPHAYFVNYLLGVRPVDEPEGQISINALDKGSLQHAVLDRLHQDVLGGTLPQPTHTGWTTEHRAALLDHFADECDHAEHTGRTGRPAAWASDRARMRRDLLEWFRRDSERILDHGATIVASEFDFSKHDDPASPTVTLDLPDGRRLAVRGQVDRLDRWADGRLVVTDHKTGSDNSYRKLDASNPTLDGSAFQLPVYAAAAVAHAGNRSDTDPPVRAEYSMFERGSYKRIGIDFDEQVWADVDVHLAHVVDGIEAGWFPQVPERPGFRMFIGCPYCEPDGLGTGDAFERWAHKQHDARVAHWFAPDGEDAIDD